MTTVQLLTTEDRAAIKRAYDDIQSCIPPKLQSEAIGRLEQLVLECKNSGAICVVFVHSSEANLLQRVFKRQFRGESYQAFTKDGAKKCFEESDKLIGMAKTEFQKSKREEYRYEADMLHRVGTRILEAFE